MSDKLKYEKNRKQENEDDDGEDDYMSDKLLNQMQVLVLVSDGKFRGVVRTVVILNKFFKGIETSSTVRSTVWASPLKNTIKNHFLSFFKF
jgi:hypothetical protein